MFRQMRRIKQQLTDDETADILRRGSFGVLALSGDNGYPYAVPLSYYFTGDKLIFHCAKTGHKLDAVKNSPKASFCVVARNDVVPEEFATRYMSAVAFGTVRIVDDKKELLSYIRQLGRKYSPGVSSLEDEIQKEFPGLAILEFTIDHVTGKKSKNLL